MTNDIALFLYGFDVTTTNQYINFRNVMGGPELTAVLNIGNYTSTSFMKEIKRAMEIVDGVNKYTVGLNRTVSGGKSNRMSVTTNGSYLDILFTSGTNSAISARDLMGFDHVDYTGALTYTGGTNAGTILVPDFGTYDYLPPTAYAQNDGVKNVSASGIKETLVFAQMYFIQGQWKYITNFGGNTQLTQWSNFLKYATRQLQFEFTPSIFEDSGEVYQVTLESTTADQNGLAFKLTQQRGEGLYRFYDTGLLKFRLIPT